MLKFLVMSRRVKKSTIIIATVALASFVAWGIPAAGRFYNRATLNNCLNHLAQIDGAKQMWAQAHGKTTNDVPTWSELAPYLGQGDSHLTWLKCPRGGTYTIGKVGEAPQCSYHQDVWK